MSFLEFQQKFAQRKKRGGVSNKKCFGRLKSASSCTDPRAWSLDTSRYRDYFLETLNVTSSSSNDSIAKSSPVPLTPPRRVRSAENLVQSEDSGDIEKLKSKLVDADDKIEELNKANINLKKKNSQCTMELDNLRSLVKDLQEQMIHLESLKSENINLHSEVGSDVKTHMLKAEEEISHLRRELDIFQEIKIKYSELREANESLKVEHTTLSRTMALLNQEKSKLELDYKRQKEDLTDWKNRAHEITTAVCEKNLLKEKLENKEKKISQLCESINEQELRIEKLNLQLQRLTKEFEHKQETMLKHIDELQTQLVLKTSKFSDIESKLTMTERVVIELESLREQFRITNSDLTENVRVYKKQFMSVLNSSNKMVRMVEKLQKELEEKEKELEKSNLFPQSPKTMVYFTQINNVIESSRHSIGNEDTEQMKDTLMTIKTIMNNLKKDMWGTSDISMIAEFSNSIVQTEFLKEDISTQVEINNTSTLSQTNYPDEYVIKYNEVNEEITKMSLLNSSLAQNNQEQKSINESLEIKIVQVLNNLEAKDDMLTFLENSNDQLCNHIVNLNEKIKYSDDLLEKAMVQIDLDSETRLETDNRFESILKSTINEYDTYIKVLESCLEYKQHNLDMACQLLENEECSKDENNQVQKLKQEVEYLTKLLEEEKANSFEQKEEMGKLLKEISEKSKYINKMDDKLTRTESILDDFIKNLGSDFLSTLEKSQNMDETNEIGIKLTMIINRYKQQLTAQLEIKHDLSKEQISRKKLKNFLKNNNKQRNIMREKILQMNVNMKKVKKIIYGLRNRLNLSERLIIELEVISDLLSSENNSLKRNNTDLIEEIGGLKIKVSNLEIKLKTQETNNGLSLENKRKMEKVILSLMKKLTKYKHLFDKSKSTRGTMTNEYYLKTMAQRDHLNTEIDLLRTENLTLSTTISKLKERFTTLFDIPQKESKEVELQVSFKEELDDEEKELLFKNVKNHYEAILKALQTEHTTEKEQSQKQYLNNLKMLKDTYERDMIALKKVHSENLSKLQCLHDEETASIKESLLLDKEKLNEEKELLKKGHKDELDALTSKYELIISQKDDLFKEEKEILMTQLSKSIFEKNSQIEKLNSDMTVNFKRYKNKCKINFKKLREQHRLDLENLVQKCKTEVKIFIAKEDEAKKMAQRDKEIQCVVEIADKEITSDSVSTNDKYTETKKFEDELIGISNDSIVRHEPLSEINFEEEIVVNLKREETFSFQPHGNSYGKNTMKVGDTTIAIVPDTSVYAEHIAQLEAELALHKREFAVKAASYEKMIRREQMKAMEIKHQYDQELEHSAKVHCRLGAQYNKAEELELENKMLMHKLNMTESQLREMENDLEKERDKTFSLKTELAKLKTEFKGSYQIEMSLNRLKKKIGQAVQYEKRLNEELKKETQKIIERPNENIYEILELGQNNNKIQSDIEEKVIRIQTCGVVQYETQI